MDLGTGLSRSTYYACLENIISASTALYKLSIEKAVAQERSLTEEKTGNSTNLAVSGDGTWKKRGFSSLIGVTTLIGRESGKVVDSLVKCSFCRACMSWKAKRGTPQFENWSESHQESCTINHSGSAGKMEVDSVKEMFSRSQELHGVQYATYIGDGDSKTFKAILDLDPYGSDVTVMKKECVGHVEKRMGSRLRALKKKTKGLGGKGSGKLTDKLILDLTKYYGLAIRRNAQDKDAMRKAVWATYYHKISTDDDPRHENCCASWCDWKKAEADGTLETYTHKPPLDRKVQEAIKPVYEDLSNDNLLERCVGANTQNSNESINSLIWTFSPKHIYSGKQVVEIANNLATIIFNDGFMGIAHTMNVMGIQLGSTAFEFCSKRNAARLVRSEHRASTASREARSAAREQAVQANEIYEIEEGVLYAPGIAD